MSDRAQSTIANSDIVTDMVNDSTCSDAQTQYESMESMKNMIDIEHKFDKILQQRLKCMWINETTHKRCINPTYKCCRACNKNGKPYLLCGRHMEDHQQLELNMFLQQLNRR